MHVIVGILPSLLTYVFLGGVFALTFCFLGEKRQAKYKTQKSNRLMESVEDLDEELVSERK